MLRPVFVFDPAVIQNVSIHHFKSIRQLDFSCKRVNLFIGEPNTGKSNLLEALGLFSLGYAHNVSDFVRMKDVTNLFFDNDIQNAASVIADGYSITLDNTDTLTAYSKKSGNDIFLLKAEQDGRVKINSLRFENNGGKAIDLSFKYYKFKAISSFVSEPSSSLYPPSGNNLFDMLLTHKPLREIVAGIIKEKGYRLNLETGSKEIKLLREVDDVVYTYPYQTISDTLQRIIFYLAAIETNKNSALIFEEPEANTFPFYTKYLAETIARDDSNQYFIATHNPYLLLSIVEKMKTSEVAVSITYQENYETRLRALSEEELSELLDLNTDVFFNFDKFLSK